MVHPPLFSTVLRDRFEMPETKSFSLDEWDAELMVSAPRGGGDLRLQSAFANHDDLDHPVILFDGVCNLCNSVVQFVIRNDTRAQFRFAALQSGYGQRFLAEHSLSQTAFDTLVLIEGTRYYTRSSAALRIARRLDGLWPALFVFILLPTRLRNWIYDQVAIHRYRWFGRRVTCMVPNKDVLGRFLR